MIILQELKNTGGQLQNSHCFVTCFAYFFADHQSRRGGGVGRPRPQAIKSDTWGSHVQECVLSSAYPAFDKMHSCKWGRKLNRLGSQCWGQGGEGEGSGKARGQEGHERQGLGRGRERTEDKGEAAAAAAAQGRGRGEQKEKRGKRKGGERPPRSQPRPRRPRPAAHKRADCPPPAQTSPTSTSTAARCRPPRRSCS